MYNHNSNLKEKFNCFCPQCINLLGMVFIGGAYIIYLYLKYYFIYLPDNFLFRLKNKYIQKSNEKKTQCNLPLNSIASQNNKQKHNLLKKGLIMQKHRESSLSVAIRNSINSLEQKYTSLDKNQVAQFTIKIANSLEERESVFHLGYQVYLEKKYIKENQNQWLIQNYDFLPQTTILIVQDKNKNIAGSLTLVFDGDGKLPVEKIYKEEIKLLKAKNIKAIEISRLVIANEYRNEKEVLQLMINYLMIYAYHVKQYNSLVIQVNPRHKIYYKALLGFEEIGGEKKCPSVQNAPAVLLHLPLRHYQLEVLRFAKTSETIKKERSLYPYFLKPEQENLVAHYLKTQFKTMSAEEKLYFGFSESGISRAVCV